MTDGWVDLLRPLPVQLQVHASPQMGLGEGSWRFFMREAGAILTRRAGGAGVAGWGVMQGNEWPRCLYHMHSLWFGPSEMRDVSWAETAQELEAFGRTLQPSWRPYDQGEQPMRVRVRPVDRRGEGADSLIGYCARYFVRMPDGHWLEQGDLSRYMRQEVALI